MADAYAIDRQDMTRIGPNINRIRQGSVLVLGDVMIDNFVYGEVNRISPEAPIPILSVGKEKTMAGGAANVALNAAAFGARVSVIGIVGDDPAGSRLRELVTQCDRPAAAELVVDAGRPTTSKTRYFGNNQQILRADRERTVFVGRDIEDELIARVGSRLSDTGVVAISDYAKGVLTDRVITEVIRLCQRSDVPLVVDPKRARWDIYSGASVIKPNLQELRNATGLHCKDDEEIDRAASHIVSELDVSVLLTRSQDGMSLYRAGHSPVHARATAHDVFDVSGAGDTALAAFSAALAAGITREEAMRIANIASGVAVTKLGTSVVTADEFSQAWVECILESPFESVVSREVASVICYRWRSRGLRVGFTNGCFDIVHAGHVSMLSEAASHCDRLVVGINSDDSVRRLKGVTRPVQGEASRAQVIAALEAASLVTVFEEDTPLELIKLLRPDILFKGADYSEKQVVGGDLVKSSGGKVVLIDLVTGVSTTNAIRRARDVV